MVNGVQTLLISGIVGLVTGCLASLIIRDGETLPYILASLLGAFVAGCAANLLVGAFAEALAIEGAAAILGAIITAVGTRHFLHNED